MCVQLCPAIYNSRDCSLLSHYIHEISQTRIPEWVAISSFRVSPQPRYWTSQVYPPGRFFTLEPLKEVSEWSESNSVTSDFLRPHGLYSPWNSPGQNTGVGSLSLLQGIFPTQGSKPGLPHFRLILYQLSHREALEEVKDMWIKILWFENIIILRIWFSFLNGQYKWLCLFLISK